MRMDRVAECPSCMAVSASAPVVGIDPMVAVVLMKAVNVLAAVPAAVSAAETPFLVIPFLVVPAAVPAADASAVEAGPAADKMVYVVAFPT